MSFRLDAESLACLSLHDSFHFTIQLSRTSHRLDLIKQWNIPSGAKVTEFGCGHGDTTTVLAAVVGEEGKVVAIDPTELEYGEWEHSLESSDLQNLSTVHSDSSQARLIPSVKRKIISVEVQ